MRRAVAGRHLVAVESNAAVVLTRGGTGTDGSRRHGDSSSRTSSSSVLPARMPTLQAQHRREPAGRSPPEYGRAYAAARRGLDLVRLLGRSGQVVSFRHMGVQEILLQAEEPAALLEFIAQLRRAARALRRGALSDLLASLETFYDAGFNLQEAARRLDVHVSTLRYRLTRIEELLGVDPKVGDSRLNIEVAVKAAKALAVHGTDRHYPQRLTRPLLALIVGYAVVVAAASCWVARGLRGPEDFLMGRRGSACTGIGLFGGIFLAATAVGIVGQGYRRGLAGAALDVALGVGFAILGLTLLDGCARGVMRAWPRCCERSMDPCPGRSGGAGRRRVDVMLPASSPRRESRWGSSRAGPRGRASRSRWRSCCCTRCPAGCAR